jgi:hypothetical protein
VLRLALYHSPDKTASGVAFHHPVKVPDANPAGCLFGEDKFTTVNNTCRLIFPA